MLTIWGRRNSQNVQKVMWLVGELELAHERIDAGGSFGGLDTPAFRSLNPHRKVPVIDDNGCVVWESHSILRYLAAVHGGEAWWPPDPCERSQVDRWLDWTATTLQVAFMEVFWGYYRTPEDRRDAAYLKGAFARCHSAFETLDKWLSEAGTAHIAGDRLSLADIAAGASLYRYFTMDIERPALPAVEQWYDRLQSRPAYREHVMVAYDDLYGRLAF